METDISNSSVELKLLALLSFPNAVSHWPESILALLTKVNQEKFIYLIRFHRVALVVSRNLLPEWKLLLTAAFLEQLQQQTTQQLQTVRQQYFQQSRLQKAFNDAGITHRFFKGLALSQQLYQDIAWRFSKDIDLLISFDDKDQASLLLMQFGFVSEFAELPTTGLGSRIRQALQKDCVFTKPDGTILELHWRLDNAHCKFSQYMAKQYLTQPVGFSVDEFVYLCVHAAKSKCHRIKWLVDVAAYALKLQQTVPDWQISAEALANKYSVASQLRLMLLLIKQCYSNLLPITIQSSFAEQKRVEAVLTSWQLALFPKRATLQSVIKPFFLMSNLSYNARLLFNMVFWPNMDDVRLLNRLTFPLNYLFLPAFPCYKVLRYLVRVLSQLIAQHNVKRSNDTAS
ncbi:nucleotidyltransferase family protein [Rheinheimera sp. UJ63]|uniref:nucleotidyltransferase family protein n=1 Tax=Rheinheimera sp. UJ63 TaxID=2910157 RepID=UPI001F39CF5A|nr:nucleotidyltransferase family protein [Rheinheimera sp. UJ63]MCF4009290.1 nucleotidyltransferase family protein [Rheinheimera sp. UJ63]